jgi:LysM domain
LSLSLADTKRARRRYVALALTSAAWLAACTGTLRGAPSAPEAPSQREPTSEAPVGREPNTPLPELQAPLPTPIATAPPTTRSIEAREKQFEILTQAVAALHQEIARNDSRSEELLKENKRLRAQVEELLRDLSKGRAEDQRLNDQLQALEKELREIAATPPLEAGERGDGHGESADVVAPTRSEAPKRGGGVRAQPMRGRGLYHVVAPGETLFRIASTYGVDYHDVARENGIEDAAHIEVGQRLFIPDAKRVP